MKLFGMEFLKEYKGIGNGNVLVSPGRWAEPPAVPEIFINSKKLLQHKPFEMRTYGSKKKVLLLSGESYTTGYLIKKLNLKKQSYISINLDEFIFEGKINFDLKTGFSFEYKKQKIHVDNFSQIYFSTPQWMIGLMAHPELLSTEERIFLNRWKTLIYDIEALTSSNIWFPAVPSQMQESSQQKLADLMLAERSGLKVPDTIVTMDTSAAKKFYKKHDGKVIFREFATRRVHKKGKLNTFEVNFLSNKASAWKAISTAPNILQQYIEKSCEYRVVVVGKQIYTCEIQSQSGSQKSKMDFRSYEMEKVAFRASDLPKNIKNKLLQMARVRNFKMCSFDLVRDNKGDFYFLEMNRPGAWLFVEGTTGLEISKAVLDAITKK